ncbi:hypothetical protein GLOIN_2v1848404 [Rhizophagus clarus]|uniref:Uncharacterized protein n=1 Tax=Rhizophagus clarus TaxID=94130 RepID=A0A8H3LHK9_9GLOM|nr:hypothetical protein GLOIN_2v1848404 [Rhizophagus clarus]
MISSVNDKSDKKSFNKNEPDKKKELEQIKVVAPDTFDKKILRLPMKEIRGIVIFVHDKENIYCFIFNVKGIYRKMFTYDLRDKGMESFCHPKRLQDELNTSVYKMVFEIASRDFGDCKILFCEFIDDDNTIIIIVQKPGSDSNGVILYWNLFSTNNQIKIGRRVNFVNNEENNKENIPSIATILGKLITIDTCKNIFSI